MAAIAISEFPIPGLLQGDCAGSTTPGDGRAFLCLVFHFPSYGDLLRVRVPGWVWKMLAGTMSRKEAHRVSLAEAATRYLLGVVRIRLSVT